MRNRFIQTFIATLYLSIFSSFLHAQGNIDEVKSKLKQIDEQWANDLKSGNYQAVLDYYADDAILLPPNAKIARGKDAIKAHYDAENKNIDRFTNVEFNSVDVLGENNLFVEVGTYKMTIEMKNMSKPVDDEGKYVTVWKMMPDGSLKIAVDTDNTDMSMKDMQNAMKEGQSTDEMTGGREKK